MKKLLIFLFLLFLPLQAAAATYWISPDGGGPYGNDDGTSEADRWDLPSDVTGLSANDVLQVRDDTYDDVGLWTLPDTDGGSGTEITLQAETVGAVSFTGQFQLRIPGDYWIITGFIFDGIEVASGDTRIRAIRVNGSNNHITECNFKNFGRGLATADYGVWTTTNITGLTVDYCTFDTVRIMGLALNTGCANFDINHNRFYNFLPKDANYPDQDDCSPVSIGTDCTFKDVDYNGNIHHNLFERCQGDTETVGLKGSSINVYINRFIGCYEVSFRCGEGNKVYNNWFQGLDSAISKGVRIRDDGHAIYNNYFQGLNGRRAVYFMPGISGDGTRKPATNVTFIHNTIADDCSTNQVVLFGTDAVNYNVPVDNIVMQNNIIEQRDNNNQELIQELGNLTTEAGIAWTDNVLDEGTGGTVWSGWATSPPTGSHINGDPSFDTYDIPYWSDDMYVLPSAASNALAVGTYNATYGTDIDGTSRANPPDVGCDEYALGEIRVDPLEPCDVGTTWGRPACAGASSGYPDILTWFNAEGSVDGSTYTFGSSEYPTGTTGTLESAAAINTDAVLLGTYGLDCPTNLDTLSIPIMGNDRANPAEGCVCFSIFINAFTDATRLFGISVDGDANNRIYASLEDWGDGSRELRVVYEGNNSERNIYTTTDPLVTGVKHEVQIRWKLSTNLLEVFVNADAALVSDTTGLTALSAAVNLLDIGNWYGGTSDFYIDNFMLSNDSTRNFIADQHNGVDFAELTAYPAGGAAVTVITIPAGTYVEGQTLTATLTWDNTPTLDSSGGFPYFFVKLAPLWGSLKFTATSATTWVSKTITDGMRYNGALVVVTDAEIQVPTNSSLQYNSVDVDVDISGLSITNSPEIASPKTANDPWLFPGDADTYTAWIAGGMYGVANDNYKFLNITDNVVVNNNGPAYFMIHELIGIFNVNSKPDVTIRGINRISGAISNPGANYSGLTYRNPCARGGM